MSKTANRNYLLVDAGINYQTKCLQIPGRYINVRDLCPSPPSRQSRYFIRVSTIKAGFPLANIFARSDFFLCP